jgi:hypothetical protein
MNLYCFRFPSLFLAVLLLNACNSRKDDNGRFEVLERGLKKTATIIFEDNQRLYYDLESKTKEPRYKVKADYWYNKSVRLLDYSRGMTTYLNGLEAEIDEFKTSKEVNHFLLDKGKGIELYNRISKFNNNVILIDTLLIRSVFQKKDFFHMVIDTTQINADSMSGPLFQNCTPSSVKSLIALFKNYVLIMEHYLAQLFLDQIPSYRGWQRFIPLIAQNTSVLKKGARLEISAGLGSFTLDGKPVIKINNREIPIGAEGTAEYTLTVNKNVGMYTIPVSIVYLDEEGNKQMFEKKIKYSVVQ